MTALSGGGLTGSCIFPQTSSTMILDLNAVLCDRTVQHRDSAERRRPHRLLHLLADHLQHARRRALARARVHHRLCAHTRRCQAWALHVRFRVLHGCIIACAPTRAAVKHGGCTCGLGFSTGASFPCALTRAACIGYSTGASTTCALIRVSHASIDCCMRLISFHVLKAEQPILVKVARVCTELC